MSTGLFPLQVGLVGLWAAWFSLVALTNILDALYALGRLPQGWAFRSENYTRVREAVAVYRAPPQFAALLFAAVIVWQVVVAALLWQTVTASTASGGIALGQANLAFTCALGLWGAFILAEEVFKQYRTETKHLLFFMAQLLSLGALHLLAG